MDRFKQYAKDVVDGKVVACRYIKLSCERFLSFFQREDMYFSVERVEKALRFIQRFEHYEGKTAKTRFQLEPFQVWVVANIYGFYWCKNDTRVTKRVYYETARKQGKTFLMSAILLYEFIGMQEPAQQVSVVANSYKQGQLIFKMCQTLTKQLDRKGKFFKQYRDEIKFKAMNARLEVLSNCPSKMDGKNLGAFLVDEYHEATDNKMYNVLLSSQGFRSNPLGIVTTTAGFNKFGACYKMRTTCIEILEGIKQDESQFTAIFTLDEGDDWTDENVWRKSNPNLNVTVTEDFIREQINIALNSPSEEVAIKTKTLNLWCDVEETWIRQEKLMEHTQPINLQDFKGLSCWMGVDLGAVSDLTAVSLCIPLDGKFYFKTFYFLPSSELRENPNAQIYREWHKQGLLHVCKGNVTDYDVIIEEMLKINQITPITTIAYDSWNALAFATSATAKCLPLKPYSQAIGNFNKPTKEFERLLLSGKVIIDDNEVTRYCFSNVEMKVDHNGNQKPSKAVYNNKIDGVISMLQALGVLLELPEYQSDIFVI